MEASRLFRISLKVAAQNNLRYIPCPKIPFNNENKNIYLNEIENFLVQPHYNYLIKNFKLIKEIDIENIEEILRK
jgi:hypothetical protein